MLEKVKIEGKETFEVEGNSDTERARAPIVGIQFQMLITIVVTTTRLKIHAFSLSPNS